MKQKEKELRLKIARLIYDEWRKQKRKEYRKRFTVNVDQYFKLVIRTKEPFDDYVDFIEKGDKIYVVHQNLPMKKRLEEIEEVEEYVNHAEEIAKEKETWKKARGRCNTCKYELFYEQYPEDTFRHEDQILYVRDCMSQEGYDYFKIHCDSRIGKAPSPPIKECPFWNENKDNIKVSKESGS